LTKHTLTDRPWLWYAYGDEAANNGVLVIRFQGVDQQQDYPQAIVGGDSYPELMDRLAGGTWVISPGKPPEVLSGRGGDTYRRQENIMWQRMRIFQLEKVTDLVWAEADAEGVIRPWWKVWRKRLNWTKNRFEQVFARARLQATWSLLGNLQIFTRSNTELDRTLAKKAGNTVISALVIAEQKSQAVQWLQERQGPDAKVIDVPGNAAEAGFPQYHAVVGEDKEWWWRELGPAQH